MSDAIFWFDHRIDNPQQAKGKAANGDLGQVMRGFEGKLDVLKDGRDPRRPDLSSMWTQSLAHVEIKSGFALFMMGTTSELVTAIDRDLKKIRQLVFFGGNTLEIRYVRRKASIKRTVSIVGIATLDEYLERCTGLSG